MLLLFALKITSLKYNGKLRLPTPINFVVYAGQLLLLTDPISRLFCQKLIVAQLSKKPVTEPVGSLSFENS